MKLIFEIINKKTFFLFLSFLLFAIAIGIDIVLFPSILTENKINNSLIGVYFSVEILGGIFASFFLSKVSKKIGIMNCLIFSSIIYAFCIAIIYFFRSFYIWLTIGFTLGFCWFFYAIIRQVWLNIFLSNKQRGVGIGIFSMLLSLGISIGTLIVNFSGAKNYFSFLISSTLVVLSLLSLITIKSFSNFQIDDKRISLINFFKKNPRCFLSRFFLDFQTYLILTFTVIFGSNIGFSNEMSGLLIGVYMSTAFVDVIVGFILKKQNPYKMINLGFLGCLSCFLMVILYYKSYYFLMLIYFLFGVSIACIYVSVFKIVNEDYNQKDLIAANSTFQIIGSIGSLFGSLIGGFFVDIFGIYGFPLTIILGCLICLIFFIKHNISN